MPKMISSNIFRKILGSRLFLNGYFGARLPFFSCAPGNWMKKSSFKWEDLFIAELADSSLLIILPYLCLPQEM
jgi:hypothetical protein